MIRVTPQRRFRVSNRAALVAALVLALTSLGSLNDGSIMDGFDRDRQAANSAHADDSASTGKRKISIGLLLFGQG